MSVGPVARIAPLACATASLLARAATGVVWLTAERTPNNAGTR